jgi:hypothetical protein
MVLGAPRGIFPTSLFGLFFTRWIVNPIRNLLKRTMTYLGFEPGTFGVAVSIPITQPLHHLGRLISYVAVKSEKMGAHTTQHYFFRELNSTFSHRFSAAY